MINYASYIHKEKSNKLKMKKKHLPFSSIRFCVGSHIGFLEYSPWIQRDVQHFRRDEKGKIHLFYGFFISAALNISEIHDFNKTEMGFLLSKVVNHILNN